MEEVWKDIEGTNGLYQVSNLGRVKSLPKFLRNRSGKYLSKERILTPRTKKKGYLHVHFKLNDIDRSITIHRLVAQAFIPNPLNLPQINHKDEDKTNNCVDNLEWCDNKYNQNYGTSKERISKALSKEVFQYTLEGNFIRKYSSTIEASELNNCDYSHISSCCRGERKTHKGYIWKYE